MINIFSIALAANESREVALAGEYFEIRSAVYPITKIELTDRSGGLVSVIDAALESDFVRPGNFETMRITNGATPQIVSFWYGSGDAGSRRFSGNVTGTVGLDVATLAALESLDLNIATINAIRRAEAHTGFSNVSGAMVANTPETVFLAAANTNGVTLLAAQAYDFAGASLNNPTLLAKATPPGTILDGAPYLRAQLIDTTSGGSNIVEGSAFKEQYIPAGLGLFWITDVATTANCKRWTRYIVH